MKKNGFTLAEVLITLGIVGVIAALTTPTLISSSRNQANASKLSSAVSNLENAFSGMIAGEGVDDLIDTTLWENSEDAAAFTGELGNYLKTIAYEDVSSDSLPEGYTGKLKNISGTDYEGLPVIVGDYIAFTLPSGSIVFFEKSETTMTAAEEESAKEKGGSLFSTAANIVIDVNGSEAPNRIGRDIFCFILGSEGRLYPYGGKDIAVFEGEEGTNTWNVEGSTYPCYDANKGDGEGCTARLIEEGYKMNY